MNQNKAFFKIVMEPLSLIALILIYRTLKIIIYKKSIIKFNFLTFFFETTNQSIVKMIMGPNKHSLCKTKINLSKDCNKNVLFSNKMKS